MTANLLHPLPDARGGERFETLLTRPGVRVERIVSHGQATPQDAPYCQPHDEWVLLLAGRARLWIAGAGETMLRPGDQRLIPAHAAHRVTWTAPDEATVWLALHFGEEG
ncbi:MAG: cupin domain-containing protein [Sphingobium sp.]